MKIVRLIPILCLLGLASGCLISEQIGQPLGQGRSARPNPDVTIHFDTTFNRVVIFGRSALIVTFAAWVFLSFGAKPGSIVVGGAAMAIAGWLFIVWKRPFVPGDRITIRAHTGDVIDQSVFVFTLLEVGTEFAASQSTGRIIHLPNGWLFTDSVINFTRGFPYVWNEIPVLVSFESNWRAAKRIMFDIANEHGNKLTEDAERKLRREAQEFLIFYSKLTPTVYTSVRDSGVELTMRYLVEPRRRRGSEQTIWEAILDGFALRDDIEFAYPTRRIFQNAIEGKPGVLPKAQRRAAGLSAAPEPPPPPPPIESDV